MSSQAVSVDGRQLKLSNLEKVLYPQAGFTKAQVIDYYLRIAPALLPHVRDRPLTLKRYPDGVEGEYFYEKRCPSHRPPWVKTANVEGIEFCLMQDLPTLAWAANLADLEVHVPLHRARSPERPEMVVFDLDPGAPADLVTCCEVAEMLRGMFEALELRIFAKTSGSKGMQIYLPLNTPATYPQTKGFARAVAEALEQRRGDLVVSNMKKSLRPGKVLVDWSQNDAHKTTVGVYSLRARERPTVSTPVTWEEVRRCLRKRDASLLVFETAQALRRVEKLGDLFAPLLELKQKLPRGQQGAGSRPRIPAAPR